MFIPLVGLLLGHHLAFNLLDYLAISNSHQLYTCNYNMYYCRYQFSLAGIHWAIKIIVASRVLHRHKCMSLIGQCILMRLPNWSAHDDTAPWLVNSQHTCPDRVAIRQHTCRGHHLSDLSRVHQRQELSHENQLQNRLQLHQLQNTCNNWTINNYPELTSNNYHRFILFNIQSIVIVLFQHALRFQLKCTFE